MTHQGQELARPIFVRVVSLASVVLLQNCATQDERYVTVPAPLSNAELKSFVAAPASMTIPMEHLSGNLDEIEACMLHTLTKMPDIEKPTFGYAMNSSGESGPSLEYGYKGYVMRFALSKSHEDGREIYTLGGFVPGIGYSRIAFMVQFLQSLAMNCGARTLIISG
jgi:hypothetical protein